MALRGLLMQYLWIAVGAVLGAWARFAVGGLISERWAGAFPWGTFVVNVTGAFLLGLLNGLAISRGAFSPSLRLALGIGFLGSYTTFSTWAFETVRLLQNGAAGLAAAYVLGSVLVGLVGVWLGLQLAG